MSLVPLPVSRSNEYVTLAVNVSLYEYDHRSYLLIAEVEETGEIVGTMRVTPRELGPIETEEYFRLPANLDSPNAVEISRFAIKRSHRKTRTFLPVISVGLFNLLFAAEQLGPTVATIGPVEIGAETLGNGVGLALRHLVIRQLLNAGPAGLRRPEPHLPARYTESFVAQ